MALIDNKITTYANPVANLPDHPSSEGWSAENLKKAFDANATGEIKDSINGIIDSLLSVVEGESGAENIGSAAIDGVTGTTVREQLESLKSQLTDIVLDEIPDGTITDAKLSNSAGQIKSKVDEKMPLSGGVLEDYTEKLGTVDITEYSYGDDFNVEIKLNTGNVFVVNDNSLYGNVAIYILGAKVNSAHSFTLIFTQPSTAVTVSFPVSVKWQNGEMPDMSTDEATYVLTFLTVDGGTTWLGMFGGEF